MIFRLFILLALTPVIFGASYPIPLPGADDNFLRSNGTKWVSESVSILTNPMDGTGQLIYGGASGVATKLSAGTSGQILMSNGSSAPSWSSVYYVAANLTGANPSMGTSNQTSYVEITNSGLTLTPLSGSAAAGVMCSTTNAATAPSTSPTTCAAGDESVGISFTIPTIGSYEVCAYFPHYISNGATGDAAVTFQLIETPTNAQTLTFQSGARITSALSTASIQVIHPNSLCGIFTWASTGTVGVRLMYEQAITATVNSNLILSDENTSNGQRAMLFTVKRLR